MPPAGQFASCLDRGDSCRRCSRSGCRRRQRPRSRRADGDVAEPPVGSNSRLRTRGRRILGKTMHCKAPDRPRMVLPLTADPPPSRVARAAPPDPLHHRRDRPSTDCRELRGQDRSSRRFRSRGRAQKGARGAAALTPIARRQSRRSRCVEVAGVVDVADPDVACGEDFQLVQGAGILRQPPVGRQRLVEEL